MNTSRSYGRRVTSGIALGTAGLVTAGLITAAPVHGTSPPDHPTVQLVALDLVAATATVPGASLSITSDDLEWEIRAAAAYVPSVWLQQAYFFVGITVGAAVGVALSFVDGLPSPLRDAGRAALQFVATALTTNFDALFFIDRQVQEIFGGVTNPQQARAVVSPPVLSREIPAPAAVADSVPGVPARNSAEIHLSARHNPARQAARPGCRSASPAAARSTATRARDAEAAAAKQVSDPAAPRDRARTPSRSGGRIAART